MPRICASSPSTCAVIGPRSSMSCCSRWSRTNLVFSVGFGLSYCTFQKETTFSVSIWCIAYTFQTKGTGRKERGGQNIYRLRSTRKYPSPVPDSTGPCICTKYFRQAEEPFCDRNLSKQSWVGRGEAIFHAKHILVLRSAAIIRFRVKNHFFSPEVVESSVVAPEFQNRLLLRVEKKANGVQA